MGGRKAADAGQPAGAPAGANADLDALFSSDTEDEEAAAAKAEARIKEGTALKLQGNDLLQAGKTAEAVASYKHALSSVWGLYRQRKVEAAVKLGTALDLNLSLCYLRLEDWQNARRTASRALEADPESAKGLYRRGVASARLGLLDAAEADLSAAQRREQGTSTKTELDDVRAQIAALKPSDKAMAKGFLARKDAQAAGDEAPGAAEVTDNTPAETEEAQCDLEWVAGGEVLDALQEVTCSLHAISQRRILCETAGQLHAIREHLEHAAALLPLAQARVDAAGIAEPPPEPALPQEVDIEPLLEVMVAGLETFRPFFWLQEKSPGEFDSLRACRKLPGGPRTPRRGLDVEFVPWGDEKMATPEDVAELLFPPTGRPPDNEAAAWQRRLFHRVFLKDASKYVAGALWLMICELVRLGCSLRFAGRRILDVGIAHGLFFAAPVAEGPAPPGASTAGDEADTLAVCQGRDRRAVLATSFTSLGVFHKWLLLAVERIPGQDHDQLPPPCGREAVAVDLCASALGLVTGNARAPLARSWLSGVDRRFLARCERWGPDALPLAQGPASAGPRGAEIQAAALKALISASGLPLRTQSVLENVPSAAPAANLAPDAETCREAARRVRAAASRLGVALQTVEEKDVALGDAAFDAIHREAIEELTRRRLREAGLAK